MQKKYRLKTRRGFNYVYRNGKSVSDRLLILIYTKSRYGLKVGFAVSKKVGKSVVRNKVRRRLREIFRALIPSIADRHSYIVVARPAAAAAEFGELSASLSGLLKKAGVLSL